MKFRRYSKPIFEYFIIVFLGVFGVLWSLATIVWLHGIITGSVILNFKYLGILFLLITVSIMCFLSVIIGLKDVGEYRRINNFYKQVANDITINRDKFKVKSRKFSTDIDTLYIFKDNEKDGFKDMLLKVSEFPLTYGELGLLESIKDREFYYTIGCYEFDDYDSTFKFVGYNFIGITNDSLLK